MTASNDRDITSELLGLVAGRRRQDDGKSRVSELFSSSSEDEGKVNIEGRSIPSSKKPSKTPTTSGDKSEDDEFDDGFGPDLMGDEEDRRRLTAMTEVEREAVLYERAQARLAKVERRELERKMRALESAEARPSRAPSAAMEKKRKSLNELKARREKKHRHDSDSDYYEEGEEREEEGEVFPSSNRKGAAPRSDSEYEDNEPVSRKERLNKAEGYLSSKKGTELVDLELANKLRLSRNVVAKWIFHPEFEETARGCLLRLSVSRGNEQVYRLVEIRKIVKYHRNYKINEATTNKAAALRYGRSEKTFRLDVVSNSEFTQAEFDRWMETMKEEHQPMITKRVAENRVAAWRALEGRPVSDVVVSAMVAAKRELGSAPRNLVSERTMLAHLREEALSNSNMDEVERIDEELVQLASEHASQLPRSAADARFEALAEINKRNRRTNVTNRRQAELKNVKSEADNRLDPFSRRKCQPTNFNAYFESSSAPSTAETTDSAPAQADAAPAPSTSSTKEKEEVIPEEDIAKGPIDLFAAAHNVDIEIDI